MQVTFLPTNRKQMADFGENLLDIAARAELMLDVSCGRQGSCGKCRVRILSGRTEAPDRAERETLSEEEFALGYRLACRLSATDDLEVLIPELGTIQSGKTESQNMPGDFVQELSITKHFIKVPAATLQNQSSDADRILMALPEKGYSLSSELLARIPSILTGDPSQVTAVTRYKEIIGLETGDTKCSNYGVAFDIGTTTVVGMLWDLKSGDMLGAFAKTNPQNVFGSDVISRIQATQGNLKNLEIMQEKIKDCLNGIIGDFKEIYGIRNEHIYEVTIVGNTTMSHLFLGVDPSSLAHAPFAPVFCAACDFSGQELSLDVNALANVHLLPNIAGHVGSDIVGVLLATGIMERKGLHLAIDVGTNGEILLAKDGRVLACSTAAGPAFEGAEIKCGMRAAAGAIEGININNGEVLLQIIGNHRPHGICGSGLIDGIAQLLDAGLIDHTGRLMDQTAALKNRQPASLVQRLRDGDKGREFVLAFEPDAGDIVITQKDIREVQLAKGAISSGIVIMLNTLGAKTSELNSISLAGAFGNYIRKESALRIGLFPLIPIEKIVSVGNAAGTGACMALLSLSNRAKASRQAEKVTHIELAGCPDFQTEFINAMSFPKNEGGVI